MNRVIYACTGMGDANPIVSIHDQGAGGNGNVLKELVEPLGAKLQVRNIVSGDPTLSVKELWGAEYQENCGLLIRPESVELFRSICTRENCPVSFVGQVTDTGRVVLEDSNDNSTPVDLPLSLVLADLPKKTFKSARESPKLKPLSLPAGTTVGMALDRVLRLPSVGSKRFRPTRSTAQSPASSRSSSASALPHARRLRRIARTRRCGRRDGGRRATHQGTCVTGCDGALTVAEAVTNLAWAPITALGDVKCSANWMWAAKLLARTAAMWDACEAMCNVMALGVSVDGGKDSFDGGQGRRDRQGAGRTRRHALRGADVRLCITDLKGRPTASRAPSSMLDLGGGRRRLGGTALAQCYQQIGDTTPDLDDPEVLKRAFDAVQALIKSKGILSGHDVSDGGILTAALEMAFAGDVAFDIDLPAAPAQDAGASGSLAQVAAAFAEEVGMLVDSRRAHRAGLVKAMKAANVPCVLLGQTRLRRAAPLPRRHRRLPVLDASSRRCATCGGHVLRADKRQRAHTVSRRSRAACVAVTRRRA